MKRAMTLMGGYEHSKKYDLEDVRQQVRPKHR